jgi:hypothetical protein
MTRVGPPGPGRPHAVPGRPGRRRAAPAA